MNLIEKDSGLSARQETIHPGRFTLSTRGFLIKSILFILLIIVLASVTSCRRDSRAQDTASLRADSVTAPDSTNQPKVNIQVNRTYDDKGNLLAFDSTYSTYYSNIKSDTSRTDSLMKSFDTWFGRNHSSLFDRHLNSLFFNDSVRYPDFFYNDFFPRPYELNDSHLRDMMHRMDSVKNQFYRERNKLQAPKKEA